tara:strand:+ start:603 stop:1103 length:501 start_codon:yes stop_codon:yes gene_type:complete
MNYLRISFGIFLVLAASRFVPHPPNFTSLLALSFYVPALLGKRFIPALVLSFVVTDFVIGFHNTIFFTWGSVVLIGLIVNYFSSSIMHRITGSLLGAVIFFIVTNFGVWVSGFYGYTFEGLLNCYILAIPFFAYSIISTLLFSTLIETLYFLFKHFRLLKYFNFKN